jgi:copper chaperone CopZ
MVNRQYIVGTASLSLLAWLNALAGCAQVSDSQAAAPAGATDPPAETSASEGITLSFAVTGMHCDGCAQAIEGTVSRIPGVSGCDASFEDSSATVVVSDPSLAGAVLTAVAEMGYTIELAASEKP